MNAWIWLLVWLLGVVASVVAHEAAHVLVAVQRYGWAYHGLFFKPAALGVGVRLEPPTGGKGLWQIAGAGPTASFMLGCLFWTGTTLGGSAAIVFASLCALNFAVAVINLIPTPITDGGWILKSWFGWTMRWRYVLASWVALELLALGYFLL